MRKLIILILFLSGAANASAECTQADLAGWWEFSVNNVSCSFRLDEEGIITKGNCQEQNVDFVGDIPFIVPYPSPKKKTIESDLVFQAYFETYGADIAVKDHCKIQGGFRYGGSFSSPDARAVWLMSGRINLEKSIVSGVAGTLLPNDGPHEGAYTMVKF